MIHVVHGLAPICAVALAYFPTAGCTVFSTSVLRELFSHQLSELELVRLRVWTVCSRGERGGSPVHGGGPLSYLQDSSWQKKCNSGNPPFPNPVITPER